MIQTRRWCNNELLDNVVKKVSMNTKAVVSHFYKKTKQNDVKPEKQTTKKERNQRNMNAVSRVEAVENTGSKTSQENEQKSIQVSLKFFHFLVIHFCFAFGVHLFHHLSKFYRLCQE